MISGRFGAHIEIFQVLSAFPAGSPVISAAARLPDDMVIRGADPQSLAASRISSEMLS